MILGLDKCDICFKMSEHRLFKDLKKKIFKSSVRKMTFAFSMNHSGQNFHCLLAVIFSKFLDGIKKEGPYAIYKVAHFHKFKHLWIYGPKAIQKALLWTVQE